MESFLRLKVDPMTCVFLWIFCFFSEQYFQGIPPGNYFVDPQNWWLRVFSIFSSCGYVLVFILWSKFRNLTNEWSLPKKCLISKKLGYLSSLQFYYLQILRPRSDVPVTDFCETTPWNNSWWYIKLQILDKRETCYKN